MLYLHDRCGAKTVHLYSYCDVAASAQIYTLSLHDALPISYCFSICPRAISSALSRSTCAISLCGSSEDRKSTRLNSSHRCTSYAVFCLKKKNTKLGCAAACSGGKL